MVKNMSGIVFNGLYLVQKEPSKGDKGLLVNGKYFIPVTNESSGAVASYYKCASVDTSAKTWSGYKAVFDSDGTSWGFDDTITEGLTYHGYIPTVGNIYSSDTTIAITNMYNSNFPAFDKLKYYWSLDGNTVDYDKISGVGMIAANNVKSGVTGKFGTCFGTSSSSGKNTGSYTNADIPIDAVSNGFTCNFWCNISSIGGDSPGFIGERDRDNFACGLFSILLDNSNSRDIMVGIGNTALWNCFGGTGVSLGQTHMITLTHDTGNKIITVYLDGAVYGTPYVYSRTFSYTSRALSLLTRFITGWIDEVAIWQAYALDANEVQILYNNGAGKFL